MDKQLSRRDAIKRISLLVGGTAAAVALPTRWTKPVIETVVSPANAAGFISYCAGDGSGIFYTSTGPRVNYDLCPTTTTAPPTTPD